jgi:hypothetical protein
MLVPCNLLVCKVMVEDITKNNEAPILRTLPHSRIVYSIFHHYVISPPNMGKYNPITRICNLVTVPCDQLVCMVLVDYVTNHFVIDTVRTVSIEYLGIPSCILPKSHIFTIMMIIGFQNLNMLHNACSL